MILAAAACIVGLALLAVAADAMVVGSARLAVMFRVSPVVVGAAVIGFGTSAPELVVSVLAAAQGSLDIAVGNIVGSNIANMTLVLGVGALICRIQVGSRTLRREAPMAVGVTVLYGALLQGGVQRWEGLLLAVGLIAVLVALFTDARPDSSSSETEMSAEVDEMVGSRSDLDVRREVRRALFGLLGTLAGAQLLVEGSTSIAEELGLAEGVVGLTLVALGTSLPELVTVIAAGRRGEDELIVGNLLGSVLFNCLSVGAAAALVAPGALEDGTLAGPATVYMIATMGVAWAMMATGRAVVRWEGALLLTAYIVAVPVVAA